MNRNKIVFGLTVCGFAILVLCCGISDSLRGVFSPIFTSHFSLSATQLSIIVTASYVSNLLFLTVGGRLMDIFSKKVMMLSLLAVWLAAQLLYIFTDNYLLLVVGMFFTLGSSTLMSTTVGMTASTLFTNSPALAVNLLFFLGTVGMVSSQFFLGRMVTGMNHWREVNVGLTLPALVVLLIFPFCFPKGPPPAAGKKRPSLAQVRRNPAFWPLVALLGLYFIAEHGVMNWFVIYATTALEISQATAATYASLFFAGVMLGRLVFSPLLDRIGVVRGLKIFWYSAAVLYCTGVLWGVEGLWLIPVCGLLFSIIYPTLVLLISTLWPQELAYSAAGILLGVASFSDILFSLCYGPVTDLLGFRLSFLLMPLCMVLAAVVLRLYQHRLTPAQS